MKSGRPRSTYKAQDDVMKDMANIADDVVTSDINDALQKSNINISQRTLRRGLKERGFR